MNSATTFQLTLDIILAVFRWRRFSKPFEEYLPYTDIAQVTSPLNELLKKVTLRCCQNLPSPRAALWTNWSRRFPIFLSWNSQDRIFHIRWILTILITKSLAPSSRCVNTESPSHQLLVSFANFVRKRQQCRRMRMHSNGSGSPRSTIIPRRKSFRLIYWRQVIW